MNNDAVLLKGVRKLLGAVAGMIAIDAVVITLIAAEAVFGQPQVLTAEVVTIAVIANAGLGGFQILRQSFLDARP